MCGRYIITTPASALAALFSFADRPNLSPRFNMAPMQSAPVVRAGPGGRECVQLRWGLVPSWAKDESGAARLINARGETVHEKPSFRTAFRVRRCLVPSDGFYEWDRAGQQKQPYRIGIKDFAPFAMAGLWERWHARGPANEPQASVETFCLITTDANSLVGRIHDRMPVILPPNAWSQWLSADTDPDTLCSLLRPFPSEEMTMHAVGRAVGNVRNDHSGLIQPLAMGPEQSRLL